MPISGKTFDDANSYSNPKVLDLFIKNPTNAYSYEELLKKFGTSVLFDLAVLSNQKKLDVKQFRAQVYYRLKQKK
jgi:hypothetical protein